MKIRDILMDIHALEEDLMFFERKYGVRSDVFYVAYAIGEEPENDSWVLDFGEWGSVYKTWLTRLASTHPHHKHVPPNIKRNRIPAPNMSFEHPNLPALIEEIEALIAQDGS